MPTEQLFLTRSLAFLLLIWPTSSCLDIYWIHEHYYSAGDKKTRGSPDVWGFFLWLTKLDGF